MSPTAPDIPSYIQDWPELPFWLPKSVHDYWENDRRAFFTDAAKSEAWSKMDSTLKAYSDDLVQRWNREIDSLLTYAGLFSAILTAFNVQSYPLLAPSPPDPVLATLQQISTQMRSFSFPNATDTPALHPVPVPSIELWTVWLNALWFSSLICSLAAASIGIIVKQWLSESISGLYDNSGDTGRLRQYRLNGLLKWRVGEIVAIVPVLLLVALVLFFAGLLVLLWQLNRIVSIVASLLIGILMAFTLITTLLPSFSSTCCYISPQSLATCYSKHYIQAILSPLVRSTVRAVLAATAVVFVSCQRSGNTAVKWLGVVSQISGIRLSPPLNHLSTAAQRACRQTRRLLTSAIKLAWRCQILVKERMVRVASWVEATRATVPNYRRSERNHVQMTAQDLDVSILIRALSTSTDASLPDHATACFAGLTPAQVVRCVEGIIAEQNGGVLEGTDCRDYDDWLRRMPPDFCSDVLAALCCTSPPDQPQERWDTHLLARCMLRRLDTPTIPCQLDAARSNLHLTNLSRIVPCTPEAQRRRRRTGYRMYEEDGLRAAWKAIDEHRDLQTLLQQMLHQLGSMKRCGIVLTDSTRKYIVTVADSVVRGQIGQDNPHVPSWLLPGTTVYQWGVELLLSACSTSDTEAGERMDGTIQTRLAVGNHDDANVHRIREYAREALPLLFLRFLGEKWHVLENVDAIISRLRCEGERAGVVGPRLVNALTRYVESKPGRYEQHVLERSNAWISALRQVYRTEATE